MLCVKNKELQATIQKQFTMTSFNIMGKVITAINKEFNKKENHQKQFCYTSSKEHYNKFLATIRNKLKSLERSIRRKKNRKFMRDNIRYEYNSETIT